MRRPFDLLLYALATAAAVVTIARPFGVTGYPPITDLPFHAATTSIFRHYFDPTFHFQEQFELTPLGVPYVSSYALGAFFMLFMTPMHAVKAASAIMLLALPAGLGTLAWGMRKSPLLGLLGAPFAWCHLTHWGFINFVAALGMFAAAVGLAIRALDRPSRGTRIALGSVLVLILFTHVFRFPFAIAAILGTAGVMYPALRRVRPVLWPMAPSLSLFALWLVVRPAELVPGALKLTLDPGRLRGVSHLIVHGFSDPGELVTATRHAQVVLIVSAIGSAFAIARLRDASKEARRFSVCAALVPIGCVLGFTLMFLVLPMEIGTWWYVYPREATAAAFLSMGLVPDLPRERLLRAGLALALGVSSLSVSEVVVRNYRTFGEQTRDFDAVVERIPQAPKLMYLVFDHDGSTRTTTPFIHLPAYVQAERGGWLSFHFAAFGASPARYREGPDAVVPPPFPRRWEWTPERFELRKAGFFDWFLIRSHASPMGLFRGDRTIVLETRRGSWWLFRRRTLTPVEATTP